MVNGDGLFCVEDRMGGEVIGLIVGKGGKLLATWYVRLGIRGMWWYRQGHRRV